MQTDVEAMPDSHTAPGGSIQVAVSRSARNGLVGFGVAIEKQRIDYLLAHLADPDFVDERVKNVYGGNFDELVGETTVKLKDNPNEVKLLERFLKEGEWEEKKDTAVARLKDVKDRQVFMKKIGKNWYLENKQREEK